MFMLFFECFRTSVTGCSRFILYFPYSSPRMNFFSKEHWFLVVENVFRNQDCVTISTHCYLGGIDFELSLDRARKCVCVCVYIKYLKSHLTTFYFFFSLFYCPGLPRFASQPEPSSVYAGNSAVLNCEVSVDLVPFVRWEQNRQPLPLDDRVIKLPSGTLVVSNATEGDGGLYRCTVESGGPPKYSDEVELKVLPGIPLSSGPVVLCSLMDKNGSFRIFFFHQTLSDVWCDKLMSA